MARAGAAAPAHEDARVAAVRSLQASAGNRAVAAMLTSRPAAGNDTGGSTVIRTPFSVAMPAATMTAERSPAAPAGTMTAERAPAVPAGATAAVLAGTMTATQAPAVAVGGSPDSKFDSHPTTPDQIVIPEVPAPPPAPAPADSSSATPDGGGPAEGVVVQLPDVIKPELLNVQACDAIGGALAYSPAIENTATPGPTEFGICRFGDCKVTGITATLASGTYTVAGTIEHKITWGVHPTTDNETDISGDTDADITKTNYPDIVKDLTPNMSSSGGRPPRNHFWAKDLTEIHEKFHADDVKGQAPGAITTAVNWLKTKTASSVADVTTLVNQIPDRVVQTLAAGMGEPGEVRAYGSGAAAYTTRAEAIDKRGKANEYK